MDNILELIKMVQGSLRSESEQLDALSMMATPPDEKFEPKMRLPVQNELPAFSIGSKSVGSTVAGQEFGVAAPVPGQKQAPTETLGQLLIGDTDASI